MFEGRKETFKVSRPVRESDSLGYEYTDYVKAGSINAYMVLEDRSTYQANDLRLMVSALVAYTDSDIVREGWLLDGKYKVVKRLPHRRQWVLYLEEVDDGIN